MMDQEINADLPIEGEASSAEASDEEVERLLCDVEALADEIALATGMMEGDAAPSPGGQEPPQTIQPDDSLVEYEAVPDETGGIDLAAQEEPADRDQAPSQRDEDPCGDGDEAVAEEAQGGEVVAAAGWGSVVRVAAGRLRSSPRQMLVAARTGAIAGLKMALQVPVKLDGPFSGLSPVTKQRLGFVGIITIVMGIASLILPDLLERNPYIEIEPTATQQTDAQS